MIRKADTFRLTHTARRLEKFLERRASQFGLRQKQLSSSKSCCKSIFETIGPLAAHSYSRMLLTRASDVTLWNRGVHDDASGRRLISAPPGLHVSFALSRESGFLVP